MFFLKELPSRQMVEGYAGRVDDFDADAVLRASAQPREGGARRPRNRAVILIPTVHY